MSWTPDTPVCGWAGVYCADGRVDQFYWSGKGCTGTFNGTNLPEKMLNVQLYSNKFTGTLVLDKLPTGLYNLDLQGNNFNGTPVPLKLPCIEMLLQVCKIPPEQG